MPLDHHSTIEPWFECQEAVILPHSDGKITLNPATVGHFGNRATLEIRDSHAGRSSRPVGACG